MHSRCPRNGTLGELAKLVCKKARIPLDPSSGTFANRNCLADLVSPKTWSCKEQTHDYGGMAALQLSQQQIDHVSACDVYKKESASQREC
ncbi:hypothetical protein WN944_013124 [Citrus x changshan-huyou]|uniref:Uncharacterized protein n=1 Tax=Citrus x changshan-huyou TaxID=2935761 RepID=A0AAP0M395_9ROSI